jgi:hypothetical protein
MLGVFHFLFLVDSRRVTRERDEAELASFCSRSVDPLRVAVKSAGGNHP